ncbi:MAG: SCO family protein [Gammaproteobacteria bacterium]|nr:SCO family protein [Gammaproteobacteria bacterium]
MRSILLAFWLVIGPATTGWALGGDFRLTAHDGTTFALEDARGKVVVMAFGYTHCPDVCPMMLARMAEALRALGPRAEQVVPVFVSVDPARDTPERLREYVRWFHPAIKGLTGSPEALLQVARQYRVQFSVNDTGASEDYTVDHGSSIYVIGTDGRLMRMIPDGLPSEVLVNTLDHALNRAGSTSP